MRLVLQALGSPGDAKARRFPVRAMVSALWEMAWLYLVVKYIRKVPILNTIYLFIVKVEVMRDFKYNYLNL
ncbi:hypothetical protein EUAN_23710 [Andreesenia angusta]|uniref:Uncharacterized protein n=2 Tax=Andreesenia angusta TaxID=39480 RepID=A0A1S1V4G8_9FIRM|nr:hypothetical protein EUAN_23710 [Andreesenia angusta]